MSDEVSAQLTLAQVIGPYMTINRTSYYCRRADMNSLDSVAGVVQSLNWLAIDSSDDDM